MGARGWFLLTLSAKPHTDPHRRSCRGPIREEICLQQKNRRRQHVSLTAPAILYGILPVYTFIPAFSASRTRRHLCRLPAGWLPRQSMAGCCRQIPESRLVRSPAHRCREWPSRYLHQPALEVISGCAVIIPVESATGAVISSTPPVSGFSFSESTGSATTVKSRPSR